jgi:hypothetical protein
MDAYPSLHLPLPFLLLPMADDSGPAREQASLKHSSRLSVKTVIKTRAVAIASIDQLTWVYPISRSYSTKMTLHLVFPLIGIRHTAAAMLDGHLKDNWRRKGWPTLYGPNILHGPLV